MVYFYCYCILLNRGVWGRCDVTIGCSVIGSFDEIIGIIFAPSNIHEATISNAKVRYILTTFIALYFHQMLPDSFSVLFIINKRLLLGTVLSVLIIGPHNFTFRISVDDICQVV
jgi:hypothetical protein